MATQGAVDEDARKLALSNRLEDFGWAVLLITIGTIWLLPERHVSEGSWLIAASLILLGLNAIRYFYGITMRGFSLVAGMLALLAGLGELLGMTLPLFAVTLIVIGVAILLKSLLEKRPIPSCKQGWCCCGESDRESNEAARR
jgi:hypothetical protein